MFRDFYRMAGELHQAVEPIKARNQAMRDKFWNEFMEPLRRFANEPMPHHEIVIDITIRTHRRDYLDFQI